MSRSEPLTAAQLRREINARAELYARSHGLLHELSPGVSPAVIFGIDEAGRHGGFPEPAYARILAEPTWARRLLKPHTASRRSVARKDWRWRELDSAVSSDALLMSIFCHPGVFDGGRLMPAVAALLGLAPHITMQFGAVPGIPLAGIRRPRGKAAAQPAAPKPMLDRTEIDLLLSDGSERLLLEAKLTESGFQSTRPTQLTRYRDLEAVFNVAALPRTMPAPPMLPPNVDPGDPTVKLPTRTRPAQVAGYQLIRNVLAAYALQASFCVLLDARRADLIEQWFAVQSAVHAPDFRWRLKLLTWQELAAVLPPGLQQHLDARYGILPG
jgi:hypothetical protein